MSLNDESPADEVQKFYEQGNVRNPVNRIDDGNPFTWMPTPERPFTWTLSRHYLALLMGCKFPSVTSPDVAALPPGKKIVVLSIPHRWHQIAQFFKPSDMQMQIELKRLLAEFHIFRKGKKERGDDLGIYNICEPGHDELIRRMLQAVEGHDACFFKALSKAIEPHGGKVGWTLTQTVLLQFEALYMQNGFEPTKQQLRESVKKSGTKMAERSFTRILSRTGLNDLKEGKPGPLR